MKNERCKFGFISRYSNEIALFLILFICYSYTFPRWADWNQNSRFYMVQAIVEHGTLSIDCCKDNTGDYALFEGHYYTDKAPGLSFLSVPLYAVYRVIVSVGPMESLLMKVANSGALASTLRQGGSGLLLDKLHVALGMTLSTILFVSLPSALLGVIFYRFLGAFSINTAYRVMVTLTYCLATIAFPYAGTFYAHQLTAVLLFVPFAMAFWLPEPDRQGNKWQLFFMGFLLGYAVLSEYPVAIIGGFVFLYICYQLTMRNKKSIGWVIFGGIIPCLVGAVYNYAIFRTPLPIAYNYSEKWVGVHGMTLFQWHAFWGITGSTYRGLFFMSPVLLLALLGFVYLWQGRRYRAEALVSGLIVISFLYFNSSMKTWAGGFSVGPRYLVPMVPFLAWPLILVLERHGQTSWGKLLFGGLALFSLISVWSLTLAGQQFPQDLPRSEWEFPLRDYALPLLAQGNIARNLGIILGLRGGWSLLPLVVILTIIGVSWRWFNSKQTQYIKI